MLRQHFNDFFIADAVIKVIAQLSSKRIKCSNFSVVIGVFYDAANPVNMGVGNLSNIISPVFPVMAVPAFFNDLSIQRPFNFTHLKLYGGLIDHLTAVIITNRAATTSFASRAFAFGRALTFTRYCFCYSHHFHFRGHSMVKFQFIDHCIEAVIMRAQGV